MEPLLQYSLHHVEPQLLEMPANPEFFGGEGEDEGVGVPLYLWSSAWLRHL